jgi:hypothetical protein
MMTPNDPNKDVKSSEDARTILTNNPTSQEEGETARAAPKAAGDLVSNKSE